MDAEQIVGNWQMELEVHYGMDREEALEKFRVWREKKKTCLRCECEKYVEYCEIHLICEEANKDERPTSGDVDRGRNVEAIKHKALRIDQFEARKRASIR